MLVNLLEASWPEVRGKYPVEESEFARVLSRRAEEGDAEALAPSLFVGRPKRRSCADKSESEGELKPETRETLSAEEMGVQGGE